MDSRSRDILESEFPSVDLPNCNVWTYLHPFFGKWSNLTAVVCGQTFRSYTFGQMYETSLRWAKELEDNFQGDKPPVVSVISPNSAEYPILYLGCLAVGSPLCPIRHDYEEDVILHMLRETRTTIVVVHPSVIETCQNILAKLDREVKVYLACSGPKNHGEKELLDVLLSDTKILDIETAKQVDPESIAMITFSSGTTGMPKGILISQKSYINNVVCYTSPSVFAIKTSGGSFQDTLLMVLTLGHCYGVGFIAMAGVITGFRTIICDPFDMLSILKNMEKYQPRILIFNPYVIDNLSRMTSYGTAFDNVEIIMNVGSQHNPDSFKELNEKTNKQMLLQECYGTSETGLVLCIPVKDLGHTRATGKLIPNTKGRLMDMDTTEPISEPHKLGELYFQLPSLMKEYLNNQESTKEVLLDGNWFRTGDVGYYDADHFIYVIERFKDLIVVKGKKVFPSSIEKVLKTHSSVLDVGVIGTPNLKTGEEEPKAFVIRNGPVEGSDLIDYVKENAPPEMWLEGGVTFVDALPRNPMGKMIRKYLRTMTWVDSNILAKAKNY